MDDITPASGKFLLRIPSGLHAALRTAAAEDGVSLNEYCARKLGGPAAELGGGGLDVVDRAAALIGSGLVGLVAFGSWARGEAMQSSDIDLLIVADPSVVIDRELYRRWDAAPIVIDGRAVEPHFVHIGQPGERVSGLWAEVAVDGIVLFERGLSLSRHLVAVRRRILAGETVRRTVHGQAYWIGAA